MIVMITSELVYLYWGFFYAGDLAKMMIVLLPIVTWRGLKLREFYLLAVCLALVISTYIYSGNLIDALLDGIERSAYLASFILLMALLREGAVTSHSVLELGKFLTRQPPGRRFFTLFAGGHFFAVMINLGALSLFAPIIQRGVRDGLDDKQPLGTASKIDERRQLSAVFRGFSWFLLWAPTAVTQAIMPTLMTGIDAARLMITGACVAIIMTCVSWFEDYLRWRVAENGDDNKTVNSDIHPRDLPARAMKRLGLVCLSLFGISGILAQVFEVTLVTAVMATVPMVVVAWVWLQTPVPEDTGAKTNAQSRLKDIGFDAMPGYFRETVFIACAGFIGSLAAGLVPTDELTSIIEFLNLPDWLLLWTLTVLVWVFGQIGLSPITMAIFLASVLSEVPDFPVDMTLAALAIAAGTAVCTTGAPFSSGAVMLAGATGYSTQTLTWRWNGTYTMISMLVLAAIYAVLLKI